MKEKSLPKMLNELKEKGKREIQTSSLEDIVYLHDILLEIFDGEFIKLEKFEGTLFIEVHTKISGKEAYRRKKDYQEFLLDIYTKFNRKVMVGVVFNS